VHDLFDLAFGQLCSDQLNLLLFVLEVLVVEVVQLAEVWLLLEAWVREFLEHHESLSFGEPLLQKPLAPIVVGPVRVLSGPVAAHDGKLLCVASDTGSDHSLRQAWNAL